MIVQLGAKGRQRWRPSGVRRTSTSVSGLRRQGDGAAHRGDHRGGTDLINLDHQFAPRPVHRGWPDLQGIARLAQRRSPPVCHGEPPAGAIGGHVDAAMVLRIAPPRPRVPRRKHRPDEADDRYRPCAVVRDAVYVPPRIAIGGDGDAEVRSRIIASAACWPDRAAIGTPAPGCAAPPAR